LRATYEAGGKIMNSGNGNLGTPQSLKVEHEELHSRLAAAVQSGGETGRAALQVERALHPHFLKEEEYALPPLGLLPALVGGRRSPGAKEEEQAVQMAGRLKADLGHMLEEHRQIVEALQRLMEAAKREGRAEHIRFAEKLMLHARTEEEVLYPAAILVGEYLKGRME
jgi:hypothetical protein